VAFRRPCFSGQRTGRHALAPHGVGVVVRTGPVDGCPALAAAGTGGRLSDRRRHRCSRHRQPLLPRRPGRGGHRRPRRWPGIRVATVDQCTQGSATC
jgi:hypothetical protein